MAGRLQHNVKLVKVALVIVLASGCFYVDPINQRPSADIVQESSAVVHRGDTVSLEARSSDPEHQEVDYEWRVFACSDATAPDGCDGKEFDASFDTTFTFIIRTTRHDPGLTDVPLQSVKVTLDAIDALGAPARPTQELVIPVENLAPDLALRADSRYGNVIHTPISLYAKVGDRDDWPTVPSLQWQVFSPPTQPTFTLVPLTVPQDPADPTHQQVGMTFTPDGTGMWDIQVTATDTLGAQDVEHLSVVVGADQPPCLQQYAPITAPAGQTLPMSEPTLFEVLTVKDDLDPYPSTPNDPILGTTTFAWSLLPPGAATRQPLTGVTGASVPLDPATYHPGDILELRVEIQDRNHLPITCADNLPTCGPTSCNQRLTWRVEVR